MVNSAESGDVQAAAPDIRFPAIMKPSVPPARRETLTARGPPYSSKEAFTSIIEPSGRCAQLLTRGLPCAPPTLDPSTASRSPRHAAENMTCRSP
jgi:hypothetical protein